MREIKFRAWDKTNKLMITLSLDGLANTGGFWNIKPDDAREVYSLEFSAEIGEITDSGRGYFHHDFANWLNEDEYSLMQYTDLKDKNGKEIYEGDIVKIYHHYPANPPHIGEVFCDTKQWRVEGGSGYVGAWLVSGYDSGDYYDPCLVDWSRAEVIGNIYENPELLK